MPDQGAAPVSISHQSGGFKNNGAAISKILAALILSLSIIAAATSVWISVHAYTPAMFWDQWTIIDLLIRTHGHPSWRQLWEQHHEHRILIGRLLSLADLFYFGGRNISLIIEIFVVQALHLSILVWIVRRYAQLELPVFLTAAGLLTYCLFSPLQTENFEWGFQITFVMAAFASSACFAAALWCSELPASAHRARAVRLFLCLLAACVAEASLANGVLVWPFLLMLAFVLGLRRSEMWVIAITGVTAIAVYLIGYRSPPEHSNPLQSIQQPIALVKYIVTYFGFSWDSHLPNPSDWPVLSESASLIAIVVVCAGACRCLAKRKQTTRVQAFLYAALLFILASAIITGLGRLGMGYDQATGSRYQLFALLFWGALGILVLLRLETRAKQEPASAWRDICLLQLALVLLLAGAGSRYGTLSRRWLDRTAGLEQGFAALAHHAYNDRATRFVYYEPEKLAGYYPYLRQHHWGPQNVGSIYARVEPGAASNSVTGYQVVPQSRCSGFLDAATPSGKSGSYVLSGWAWDRDAKSPPVRIVVASLSGRIAGFGNTGLPRPDVAKANSEVGENTGWLASVEIPQNGTYGAFAVLSDEKSACALANVLLVDPAR